MPLPTDPLLATQWHLINTTAGQRDLNVQGVWNPASGLAYTGAGVRVVVINDGFDYTHPDLAPNYNTSLDFDYVGANDFDSFGDASNAHGTAVAGLIGADDNGTGAVGIAFNSELVGYRVEVSISDTWLTSVGEAIGQAATNALGQVINVGQNISNDTASEFANGYTLALFDTIRTSIGTAVSSGRGNLGAIIVKSAGDARAASYDVNSDRWGNDTRQIVVAAVDATGTVSSYSSYGAVILVSGFGGPGNIVTTDRVGAAGFDPDDFDETFQGTSAAAAMVSGVVALMLEANPGLGWRDVQTILANSARHVGSNVGGPTVAPEQFTWGFNAAATWNGGGLHFSNDYGYGLVDALAAVRMAENWLAGGVSAATNGNEFSNIIDVLNVNTVIPDGNATGLTFSGNAAFDDVVERVTVTVTFTTTFMGDVEIYLTSPDGTTSILTQDQAGSLDFNGTWTFESQAFRGERAGGTWSVRVVDDAGGDALSVSDIVIRAYGASTVNDRYVYTDEYSDYFGTFGHVNGVNDTNGGTDTVNAAAVTTASTIRLGGGNSFIDGIVTQFTNIEHAVGGDGADSLVGSVGNNLLVGGRGNDTLDGGAGIDTLSGGVGSDVFLYNSAAEIVGDSIDGGADAGGTRDQLRIAFTGAADFSGVTFGSTGGDTSIESLVFVGINHSAVFNASQFSPSGISDAWTIQGDGGTDTVTINNISGSFTAAGFALSLWNAAVDRIILNGGAGADSITGTVQADSLTGGGAADTLTGGGGADTMTGGDGADFYYVDNAGDTIVEGAGGATGYDIVIAGVNYILSDNVEQLVIQGGATAGTGGSTANYLYGGNSGLSLTLNGAGGDDVIYAGLAGGNTLIGGSGVDTLLIYGGLNVANGGFGSDIYYTYTATDQLSEAGGDGIDTVFANWNITLGAGLEQLILFGGANTAVGSVDNNIIYGNGTSGAVTIFGLAGADVIFGGAANDALNGGTENDYLFGLGGINTLIGGGGNDIFYCETFGNAVVENLGEGFDTMYSNSAGISVLAENVEQLILYGASTGGTGSSLGDYIYGNASANALLLSGGDGFDYILGSNQNDTFIGGIGNDTLDLRGAGAAGSDFVKYNQVGNFGGDYVIGFDSDPAAGQDLIDILGMGYGAVSFGTTIIIGASGADTLITFQGATNLAGTVIRLQGVSAATVTLADFLF